jgi:excisionase family DNA binding protein
MATTKVLSATEANELRTVAEQAELWKVSKATIYRLARLHGLPVIRLHDGADIRLRPSDVQVWLDERAVVAK